MKKIEAVIRSEKFQEVKQLLHEHKILFFTYWDVTGIGNEIHGHVYRGVPYSTSDIPRRMISIVVRDEDVQVTIDILMQSARTGIVGDGKIFVSTIDEVYRIRTGESGIKSLD